nr:hypothetical protein [Tanacetum cinerariifolium]
MAALLYKDDHNKVAYLEKGKGWEAYDQILDFLNRSHIRYALTHQPPIVFDSLVKQFCATATVRTLKAGPSDIIATIDGNEVVVTESLIRTQLQLNDVNGLYKFTLHDVLDGMQAIGYPIDGSLTFYKAKLSPQWRFLIRTLIHCLCVYSYIFWSILPCRMNEVSCGVLLYADHIVSRSPILLVVLFMLMVPTGSGTTSAGRY